MTDLVSCRLDLPPVTVEALEALIAGDREALQASTGAAFPTPLTAPPLTEDALPYFRDVLREDASAAPWWGRWLIERASRAVVGMAGFSGPPDAVGTVTLGYSVYPVWQRQGLAAEAAIALTEWAFAQPGVCCVRATIPPGHVASEGVAARAGLRRGDRVETEEGPLDVWERCRP